MKRYNIKKSNIVSIIGVYNGRILRGETKRDILTQLRGVNSKDIDLFDVYDNAFLIAHSKCSLFSCLSVLGEVIYLSDFAVGAYIKPRKVFELITEGI